MIHRDVKPSNVMVEETVRGVRATLTDFGLVKALESSESLTSAGTILGSPEYMAPEQADPSRAGEIGPATDRYALGVVAYEMLAGRVPFPGDTPGTLNAHLNLTPPDPQTIHRDLLRDIAQVLLKALSKSPRERYPTATAMVEALRPEKKVQRKPISFWGWVAVGVIVLALVGAGVGLGSLIGDGPTPVVVPTATSTQPVAGAVRVWEPDDSVIVYVPAGVFLMGDDKREVYLGEFWIGRTPVTNAQYARFVADTGRVPPKHWGARHHPKR